MSLSTPCLHLTRFKNQYRGNSLIAWFYAGCGKEFDLLQGPKERLRVRKQGGLASLHTNRNAARSQRVQHPAIFPLLGLNLGIR
jgi:hypothetical protein